MEAPAASPSVSEPLTLRGGPRAEVLGVLDEEAGTAAGVGPVLYFLGAIGAHLRVGDLRIGGALVLALSVACSSWASWCTGRNGRNSASPSPIIPPSMPIAAPAPNTTGAELTVPGIR